MAARLTAQKNGTTFVTGSSPLQEIVQQARLVVFITKPSCVQMSNRPSTFIKGFLASLTELFENRDYAGSTHFFFDIGNGNCLAFFDMPGLGLGDYQEVLGGHHHLAISMTPNEWNAARDRLEAAGVETAHVDGSSLYFSGPDGERLELISDPLGEMYGSQVL